MATPEPASSLALLSALCDGQSIYDEHGRRYEMWEANADKPGGPSIVRDMFLEPPGREPEADPNANRVKVEWPDAVRILVRNPKALGYDCDGFAYWWGASNIVMRATVSRSIYVDSGSSFNGNPEFLYFDKGDAE